MRAETPSVLLIYTGGTIGMIENPETGALENFNFDHLLKHVPELKRFNYRISSYQFDPPLDSSDMEPAYWAKLVKIINYNYEMCIRDSHFTMTIKMKILLLDNYDSFTYNLLHVVKELGATDIEVVRNCLLYTSVWGPFLFFPNINRKVLEEK